MFLTNLLAGTLGLLWALLCIVYLLLEIYFSYIFYGFYFGLLITVFIIGFCFVFRFTLPLSIGLFLGLLLYGLDWYFALLIAFPSILLIFPSSISIIFEKIKSSFNSREESTFNNQLYENAFEEEYDKVIKAPSKKKTSKPIRFKEGDLITSEYELEDENGKKYKGVGKVLGINKFREKKGNRFVNVEYYEVKFGSKKLDIKVSSQRTLKLKKHKS